MKFNRKIIDPYNSREDAEMLDHLRMKGWTRLIKWHKHTIYEKLQTVFPCMYASAALTNLFPYISESNKKIFLDVGCGKSPDWEIAERWGFKKAWRLDLFEPYWIYPNMMQTDHRYSMDGKEDRQKNWIRADACKNIPLKKSSVDVVITQAMLNLMSPEDRKLLYKNVKNVLKTGGLFSIYICKLKNEWDWNMPDEKIALIRLGFKPLRNFVFVKE